MEAKPGDRVRVATKNDSHEGLMMPNEQSDSLVLKLESGYNIGIDKKKIKKIDILGSPNAKINVKKNLKPDKNKPTIAVLHTGGTIASKVDYETGGVSAKFSAEDLIEMVPELAKIANIKTELVANMMSEDMGFSDHEKIAKAVKRHASDGVKGVIIGHGTDTLGYTAAALSFMFEKLNIPLLLVGSQRSSDRGSTDAVQNLICAANFIAKTDFSGVATCMHDSSSDDRCAIIAGTKARKMHTSRRDAFRAVNDKPYAYVYYETGKIEQVKDYPDKPDGILLKNKMSNGVGLLKTHPGLSPKLVRFYAKNYQAIVIEGTGLGHAPTNLGQDNLKNYEILKKYIESGGIVAMTSQCIYGRVHADVYSNLRRLRDIGVIFCEDILPETAFMKLSWLMGNYPKEKVRELLPKNLRGEINERITPDEYLSD